MSGSYSWSFATAANTQTPTQLPLVYQSNLQYVGAFRVPNYYNSTSQTSYNGQGVAYDSANNGLLLAGYFSDNSIDEVSIPSSIVNSSNLNNLSTATILQPFTLAYSEIPNVSNLLAGDSGGTFLGGLQVVNGQLLGTEYNYYDTSFSTEVTTFRYDSLNLSTAQVEGMFEVGGITLGGGAPDRQERRRSTTAIWLPFHPTGSLCSGRHIWLEMRR